MVVANWPRVNVGKCKDTNCVDKRCDAGVVVVVVVVVVGLSIGELGCESGDNALGDEGSSIPLFSLTTLSDFSDFSFLNEPGFSIFFLVYWNYWNY